MAISEAVEDAATRDDTKYALGSVLNHVLLHQTVIGQEAILQMEMAGEEPDIVIGCVGGGSNFAGLAFPFVGRMLRGEGSYRVIAVEPEATPSLTRGVYAYDFGDTAHLTPLVKMHTLGSEFIPEPIHAGGLRYHGMAPLVSFLKDLGYIEARAVHQNATFAAGVQFARTEGILPARSRTTRSAPRWTRRSGPRRKASPGDPVQPVGAWPLRPGRVRALPVRGAGGLRVPDRTGRACAGGAPGGRLTSGRDASARRPGAQRRMRHMPRLACWSCGLNIYATSPLESLFAEERRCPGAAF